MSDDDTLPAESHEELPLAKPGGRHRALWLLLALLVVVALALWLARKPIADGVISGELAKLDLPATYKIEKIGTGEHVLRNLVVGDPARPDLTVEQATVELDLNWGWPRLGRVTLVNPRLRGSYRGGKLSFGALDPLIFTDSKEPFRLPDLDIALRDGRASLESDYGPVGIKIEGEGALRDGFSGTLAVVAPELLRGDCRGSGASIYGKLSVADEKPHFAGPLRLASLSCGGLRLANMALALDATLDRQADGGEGRFGFTTGNLAQGSNAARAAKGSVRFAFRNKALTAHYDLGVAGITTPQAALASLGAEGTLRALDMFARVETEGDLSASGLRPGAALDRTMAGWQQASAGTLAAPLLAQARGALAREGAGSSLRLAYIARQQDESLTLIVPQGNLRGTSGQSLLALSRFQLTSDAGPPRFSGNFASGGPGLPRLAGRTERGASGAMTMRIAMSDYTAPGASLALPELVLVQSANGALGFSGSARLSGILPGGAARNLSLPIEGAYTPGRGLAVWRTCTRLVFDSLSYANLTLEKRGLMLCPPAGQAILSTGAGGMKLAAGASALDLAGKLGSTPIRIASGPVGFAFPGQISARALDIALGSGDSPVRFRITNLAARSGADIAGTFAGTNALLPAVPLDIVDASGTWRYADGRLSISQGAFRLEDREPDDRFNPLLARGASLQLAGGVITAEAPMVEPASGREVVRAALRHDLNSGTGGADLTVAGIRFDDALQPDMLTRYAYGTIAFAKGTVSGSGRIDWNADRVTSTGTFTTPGFDFAAGFGPVKGASGTIHFTDLLGLVSTPDQTVKLPVINPGIEVFDGVLTYELRPGNLLAVKGGRWPFFDGELVLDPTEIRMDAAETRRMTLRMTGFDAAHFIARMDMGNISASGKFDGVMPLVFDENGGRVEGGELVSRPPGGNVSYIGELSYAELPTMAKYAFDSLKSIDYRQMRIDLDGAIAGEIVTRVSFEGLSQGTAARRNFVTRQIARLPIRFNVNMRAPFYKLFSSLRSIYDPDYAREQAANALAGPIQPAAIKDVP